MKTVLLAGGLGTRISEATDVRPKPMVEVGGMPIIWHIMKLYTAHGITEFVICLGYKGYVIKEYFQNYFLHTSDVTIDIAENDIQVHRRKGEPWKITLVETGDETMTGGRLKQVLPYVEGQDSFCLTYGDGVGNVDIRGAIEFHKSHGKLATVTAVQPPGRFGALELEGTNIKGFKEKPANESGWINGGFFVLSPEVGSYIEGDATMWEREPMQNLASDGQLQAWFHRGFWQPMDTLRDQRNLNALWISNQAPWRIW